jgi:hypothetical protein
MEFLLEDIELAIPGTTGGLELPIRCRMHYSLTADDVMPEHPDRIELEQYVYQRNPANPLDSRYITHLIDITERTDPLSLAIKSAAMKEAKRDTWQAYVEEEWWYARNHTTSVAIASAGRSGRAPLYEHAR